MMTIGENREDGGETGGRRERIRNAIIREKMEQKATIVDGIRKRKITWFGHYNENGKWKTTNNGAT